MLIDLPEWSYLKTYTPKATDGNFLTIQTDYDHAYEYVNIQVKETIPSTSVYVIVAVVNENNCLPLPFITDTTKKARIPIKAEGIAALFAIPFKIGATIKLLYSKDELNSLDNRSNIIVVKCIYKEPISYPEPPVVGLKFSQPNLGFDLSNLTKGTQKIREAVGSIESAVNTLVDVSKTTYDLITGTVNSDLNIISGTKPFLDSVIEDITDGLSGTVSTLRGILDVGSEQLSNAIVNRTNNHIESDARSQSFTAGTYLQQRAPLIESSSRESIIASQFLTITTEHSQQIYKTLIKQANTDTAFSKKTVNFAENTYFTFTEEYVTEGASIALLGDGVYIEAKNKLRGSSSGDLDNKFIIEAFEMASTKASIAQMQSTGGGQVVCIGGNVFINCGNAVGYSKPEYEVTRKEQIYQYQEHNFVESVDAPSDGYNVVMPRRPTDE